MLDDKTEEVVFDSLNNALYEYLENTNSVKGSAKFEKLKNDYINFIKEKEAEGVNVRKIFVENSPKNKEIFLNLINLFNNYAELFDDTVVLTRKSTLEILYDEVKKWAKEQGMELLIPVGNCDGQAYEYKENYLGVALMMHYFMDSGYIAKVGGKIVPMSVMVEPTDVKALKEFKEKSEFGLFEAVVTKDGKLYMCLDEHEILVNYLLAQGVDVKGALRINQSPLGNDSICFSSLYHFNNWCSDVVGDKQIKLTDEQAKTIVMLLLTIKKNRLTTSDNSLMKVLEFSSNLVYNLIEFTCGSKSSFDLKIARWNMLTLEEASHGEINASEMQKRIVDMYRRSEDETSEGRKIWNQILACVKNDNKNMKLESDESELF